MVTDKNGIIKYIDVGGTGGTVKQGTKYVKNGGGNTVVYVYSEEGYLKALLMLNDTWLNDRDEFEKHSAITALVNYVMTNFTSVGAYMDVDASHLEAIAEQEKIDTGLLTAVRKSINGVRDNAAKIEKLSNMLYATHGDGKPLNKDVITLFDFQFGDGSYAAGLEKFLREKLKFDEFGKDILVDLRHLREGHYSGLLLNVFNDLECRGDVDKWLKSFMDGMAEDDTEIMKKDRRFTVLVENIVAMLNEELLAARLKSSTKSEVALLAKIVRDIDGDKDVITRVLTASNKNPYHFDSGEAYGLKGLAENIKAFDMENFNKYILFLFDGIKCQSDVKELFAKARTPERFSAALQNLILALQSTPNPETNLTGKPNFDRNVMLHETAYQDAAPMNAAKTVKSIITASAAALALGMVYKLMTGDLVVPSVLTQDPNSLMSLGLFAGIIKVPGFLKKLKDRKAELSENIRQQMAVPVESMDSPGKTVATGRVAELKEKLLNASAVLTKHSSPIKTASGGAVEIAKAIHGQTWLEKNLKGLARSTVYEVGRNLDADTLTKYTELGANAIGITLLDSEPEVDGEYAFIGKVVIKRGGRKMLVDVFATRINAEGESSPVEIGLYVEGVTNIKGSAVTDKVKAAQNEILGYGAEAAIREMIENPVFKRAIAGIGLAHRDVVFPDVINVVDVEALDILSAIKNDPQYASTVIAVQLGDVDVISQEHAAIIGGRGVDTIFASEKLKKAYSWLRIGSTHRNAAASPEEKAKTFFREIAPAIDKKEKQSQRYVSGISVYGVVDSITDLAKRLTAIVESNSAESFRAENAVSAEDPRLLDTSIIAWEDVPEIREGKISTQSLAAFVNSGKAAIEDIRAYNDEKDKIAEEAYRQLKRNDARALKFEKWIGKEAGSLELYKQFIAREQWKQVLDNPEISGRIKVQVNINVDENARPEVIKDAIEQWINFGFGGVNLIITRDSGFEEILTFARRYAEDRDITVVPTESNKALCAQYNLRLVERYVVNDADSRMPGKVTDKTAVRELYVREGAPVELDTESSAEAFAEKAEEFFSASENAARISIHIDLLEEDMYRIANDPHFRKVSQGRLKRHERIVSAITTLVNRNMRRLENGHESGYDLAPKADTVSLPGMRSLYGLIDNLNRARAAAGTEDAAAVYESLDSGNIIAAVSAVKGFSEKWGGSNYLAVLARAIKYENDPQLKAKYTVEMIDFIRGAMENVLVQKYFLANPAMSELAQKDDMLKLGAMLFLADSLAGAGNFDKVIAAASIKGDIGALPEQFSPALDNFISELKAADSHDAALWQDVISFLRFEYAGKINIARVKDAYDRLPTKDGLRGLVPTILYWKAVAAHSANDVLASAELVEQKLRIIQASNMRAITETGTLPELRAIRDSDKPAMSMAIAAGMAGPFLLFAEQKKKDVPREVQNVMAAELARMFGTQQ